MNHVEFMSLFEDFSDHQCNLIELAYILSKDAHRSQNRRDGERYFEHPRRVAIILFEAGVRDVDIICAALLHDVVEDTKYITVAKLRDWFGNRVARIVDLVTKEPEYNSDIYYVGIATSWEACLVKMADRTDNLRSMSSLPRSFQDKQLSETTNKVFPLEQAAIDRANLGLEIEKVTKIINTVGNGLRSAWNRAAMGT